MLIPRNAGDVHVYRRGRWSVATSAAGGLQALEFVQCLVEFAIDRSLVARELGKAFGPSALRTKVQPSVAVSAFRFASIA